jgi:hypothetical protein
MNSIHKKLSALSQSLVKLGHDKDDLLSAIQGAIKEESFEGDKNVVTKTNRGISIKVPLDVALKQLGILKNLGIRETLLDEGDDEEDVDEEE